MWSRCECVMTSVLDDELLGNSKRTGDGAGVDEDAVVDEQRGGSLPGTRAAEGAEHANLHVAR